MMTDEFETWLGRLRNVKRSADGDSAEASCPLPGHEHGDRKRSLTISRGHTRAVVVTCHKANDLGHDFEALRRHLGLTRDGAIETTSDYVDEDGRLLYQAVRSKGKRFWQRRPDGAGGWINKLGTTRRVLYRLPEVIEAVEHGRTVYIVEGEKDVHALEAVGVTATCNPMGAGKWREDYARPLAGANVIVVQDKDADDTGQRHAREVATSLAKVRATVQIVEAVEGKDAYDHLRAGHTVEEFVPVTFTPVMFPERWAEARIDHNGSGPVDSVSAGETYGHSEPLRLRRVDMSRVRPLRWLWERRIPLELLSLLVGEESAGKGTLIAWVIAQATHGTLPGDLAGEPVNVLIIGDEDGFERIWVPRLHLAGADLDRVRTLADGEQLDDLAERADALAGAVQAENVGWVILDALLDHVDGGRDGSGINNPKHVRKQLAPLRAVAAQVDLAVTGLMHPVKGSPSSFRDLLASSHQFNAVSRSSLWLGPDPDDADRRILVRGKGNHTAEPRSVEFTIAGRTFEFNGHRFEMPFVVDVKEGDRTIKDLVGPKTGGGLNVTQGLALKLTGKLNGQPTTLAALARSVDRSPKDRSVRVALDLLKDQGLAERTDEGWKAVGGGEGVTAATPSPLGGSGVGGGVPPTSEHPTLFTPTSGHTLDPLSGLDDDLPWRQR